MMGHAVVPDFSAEIARAKADAKSKKDAAAMNGSWGDGGAGRIEGEIAAFEAGLAGRLPPTWVKYSSTVVEAKDRIAKARADIAAAEAIINGTAR